MLRTRKQVTTAAAGDTYQAQRGPGSLSIIKPAAGRSLIRNGAFRRSWRYWDIGAEEMSLQLDYGVKRYGPYGLRVRVGAGSVEPYVRCSDPNLATWTAGVKYAFRFWVYPSHATAVKVYFSTGSEVAQVATVPNRWNQVEVAITKTSTGADSFRIGAVPTSSVSATGHYFVLSEVQVEIASKSSTFIDGFLSGPGVVFGDYLFEGIPGDSPAVRSVRAIRGGEVINLKAFGFDLIAINGLGVGPLAHSSVERAAGGSSYQGTAKEPQSFEVVGEFNARNPRELAERRRALWDALSPYRTGQPKPVVLRYRVIGEAAEDSRDVDVVAVFNEGLSGTVGGNNRERVALSFTTFEPAIMRPELAGAALFGWKYASPLLANGILSAQNKATGQWSNIGNWGGVNGVTADGQGNFWIYGFGTSLGGVANANYIARYTPATGTVTGFGTAAGGGGAGVQGVYCAPSGLVYVYGAFTQIAGVAAVNLAIYNPTTGVWSAFGDPNNTVRAVIEWNNLVIVGGSFTVIGGVSLTAIAAKSGTSPWFSVTLALVPSRVDTLTLGADNNVYISGEGGGIQSFIQAYGFLGGSATVTSTLFAGETFASGGRKIQKVARLSDGRLVYSFDQSTTATTLSALYATDGYSVNMKWVATLQQQNYPTGPTVTVTGLRVSPTGALSVGVDLGSNTGINGFKAFLNWFDVKSNTLLNKPVAALNTGGLVPSETIFDEDALYSVYVQKLSVDQLLLPGVVSVTNVLELVSPRFTVQGPGQLVCIENYSTGQRIDLNLTLANKEVLTIDCASGAIVSTLRGPIAAALLTVSSIVGFVLKPGENIIGVSLWPAFVSTTTAGSPTITKVYLENVTRATSKDGRVYCAGTGTGFTHVRNEDSNAVNGSACVGHVTNGALAAITSSVGIDVLAGFYQIGGYLNVSAIFGATFYIDSPLIDMDWPDIVPSLDYAFAE